MGLTCAACHTGQLTYNDTAIRIDGAPTTADLMGFFEEIRTGLIATLGDSAKLERFVVAARDQGGRAPTDADRTEVRKRLTDTLAWFEDYKAANHTDTLEGYGRLDAVGRIHNQVARFTSDVRNSKQPNAPASFPLLWDAPRHDYVQWAAFAPNAGPGSLGRNAGEVLGVFGQVEVQHYEDEESAKKGYRSTIEGHALVSMEESLYRLQSPVWPESVLPAIDRAKAERGAALYQANCVSCHALLDRDDPQRKVTAMVTGVDVVGTDPLMVENLVSAMFPSGKLEGVITPDGTRRYGAMESGPTLSQDLVIRSLSVQPTAAVRALAYAELNGLKEAPKQGNHTRPTPEDPTADLRAYKARPLNGAWASSPYLHNGSVPTLYDLLLPPEQRPARFAVGRWAYDPVKVGYVSEREQPFVLDTSVPGNRNIGHVYGTTLSDEERWALLEYLKTL